VALAALTAPSRCERTGGVRKLLLIAVAAALVLASPANALPRKSKLRQDARSLVAAGAPGVIVLARDGLACSPAVLSVQAAGVCRSPRASSQVWATSAGVL
jgi:hypothetical protein